MILALVGLILAPSPTIRGFRTGLRCRNAYRLDSSRVLLLPFSEVQRIAGVAKAVA